MNVSGLYSGIEVVILDFDGVLTDVDIEGAPFTPGFKHDIGQLTAQQLEMDSEEFERRWNEAENEVTANPLKHGLKMSRGRIVAPAYADPYLKASSIAGVVFDRLGLYPDAEKRWKATDGIFRKNYANSATAFKPEADDFLCGLESFFGAENLFIVTNSTPEEGKEAPAVIKLRSLPHDHSGIKVYTGAQKQALVDNWTEVRESTDKGFGRPLYLRRERYWDVLTQIRRKQRLKQKRTEQVMVIGDIFEFDLLLPLYMGMHGISTPRPYFPQCERNAVRSYNKGFVADNLMEALTYLEQKRSCR